MKKIKKVLKILVISLIFICFYLQLPTFARYYESIENILGQGVIAEPIIIVENLSDTISMEVNKKTEVKEYNFIIKNYELDSSNNKKISEVDFCYDISIQNYDDNFPIEYELYDCITGEELLNGRNNSDKFQILKNVEFEKEYKLVVSWKDKNDMSSIDDIDIIINISQVL